GCQIKGICPFKEITGLDCPTCGLTRSFIAISHMQFERAWHFNRMGIFLYIYLLIHISYRLALIWKLKNIIFFQLDI
ncbi:MAG: DUF2752 domain-containing protein, partial [Thermodesulfobacteriota bacterium]